MALALSSVRFTEGYGNNITCLDSWHSMLILGTKTEGVLVFEIESRVKGITAAVEGSLRFLRPIEQLTAAEDWNILLVLCHGRLSVYKISCPERVLFTHKHTFHQTNIEKFALCTEGQDLLLCIAVPGHVYIYQLNGVEFYEVAKFAFPHVIQGMVLAPTRLYITYKTSDDLGACSCIDFMHRGEISVSTPPIFSAPSIQFITNYGCGRALVQQGSTSYILEDSPRQELQWITPPKAIVDRGKYCIGITDNTVEASTMPNPLFLEVLTKEPLQYITNKKDIYIASSNSVWRIVSSSKNTLPEEKNRSPSLSFAEDIESRVWRLASSSDDDTLPELYRPTSPSFTEYIESTECTDDSMIPPANFSPQDPLSVVGLDVFAIDYLKQYGITTVQDFAEVPLYTVYYLGKSYMAPRRKAEKFVKDYRTKHLVSENEVKLKEIGSLSDLNPEDPLEAIGMSSPLIQHFAEMMVFTVRQFATLSLSFDGELADIHATARGVLQQHDKKHSTVDPNMCGYIYLTTNEFSNVLDNREIKSAYVMFQEYMDCEPEQRLNHPWVGVYNQFYLEVKGKMGRDDKFYQPTDADVFSYMTALHVTSIGKFDATAGSRAIFFHVDQYQRKTLVRKQAPHALQINLTTLCKNGGKLYTRMNGKEWTHVTLAEYQSEFYQHVAMKQKPEVPLGCIVLPSGTIDWDHIVANTIH